MNEVTLATAIIGATTGAVGAILGVINLIRSISSSKVSIRVVPEIFFKTGDTTISTNRSDKHLQELLQSNAPRGVKITVTNFSVFPVRLKSIGMMSRKSGYLIHPNEYKVDSADKQLPTKIESRQTISVYFIIDSTHPEFGNIGEQVFVVTDCGVVKRAKSPAFTSYLQHTKSNC